MDEVVGHLDHFRFGDHIVLFQIGVPLTFDLIGMFERRDLFVGIDLSQDMVPFVGDIAVHRRHLFHEGLVVSRKTEKLRPFFAEVGFDVLMHVRTTDRSVATQKVVTQIENLLGSAATLDRCIGLRIDSGQGAGGTRLLRRRPQLLEPLPCRRATLRRPGDGIVEIDTGDSLLSHQLGSHPLDTFIVVLQAGTHDQKVVADFAVLGRLHLVVVRIERHDHVLDPFDTLWHQVGIGFFDILGGVKTRRHENLSGLVEVNVVRSDDDNLGVGSRATQTCGRHDAAGSAADDHDLRFLVASATGMGIGRSHRRCSPQHRGSGTDTHEFECVAAAQSLFFQDLFDHTAALFHPLFIHCITPYYRYADIIELWRLMNVNEGDSANMRDRWSFWRASEKQTTLYVRSLVKN